MPMATRQEVLARVAPLTHADRIRQMVAIGQQARHDRQSAAALDELEQGGFYERWLAMHSCYGSADTARIVRGLSDPSQIVRNLAIVLAALYCDDRQILTLLKTLPPAPQKRLMIRLVRRRRSALIDIALATADPPRQASILSYAGLAGEAHVSRQALRASHAGWGRLARTHPDYIIALLRDEARASTRFDQRLLWLVRTVLPVLARERPDQALELVRDLSPHIAPAQLDLQCLISSRPQAIADLMLQSADRLMLDLSRVLRQLDTTRLRALLERGLIGRPESWLHRLSPEQRRHAYAVAGRGWRTGDGQLSLAIVLALPGELRVQEARRNLALVSLVSHPEQRLPYASALPWDEAKSILEPALRSPDPGLRAIALPALIAIGRYQSERLGEILQTIRARRNEQDPIRRAMLQGLAALPPSRWRMGHLADLGQILRDTLDAADCSPASAAAAEDL